MNTPAAASVPLACVPGAIPASERPAHFGLINDLFSNQLREKKTVAGGYAFRFPAWSFETVARFVSNERKCCPFAEFQINVAAGEADIWLIVTGPDGTRELLEAELPLS